MDLKQIALIYFGQHLEKILRGIIAISAEKRRDQKKKTLKNVQLISCPLRFLINLCKTFTYSSTVSTNAN